MVDFSKLFDRPPTSPPKVPGLSIGVTGHRPDKLGGYGADFSHPIRQQLRAEIWNTTTHLIGHASRNNMDAGYRNNFLRRVTWQNGWEVDEKWRTIEVLCLHGGAQGADQDAAAEWHRMGLPYVVVAPFPGQDSPWPEPAQVRFAKVLKHAAGIYLVNNKKPPSREEASSMLLQRNIVLCQMSDELIAVWDGSRGGTSHCVNWWNRVHYHAHYTRLDPRDWSSDTIPF